MIDDILPSNTLMLGSYLSTNDPKETKQWEFNIGSNQNRDLAKYDMDVLSKKLSDALKCKTKVICFSKDEPGLTGNHLVDIFYRGYSKPRMWAQYAEKHSGVCLIFDREKLENAISEKFKEKYVILKGDVSYINRSVVPNFGEGDYTINVDHLETQGFDRYVNDHFHQYNKRLFFEKMTDWEHENEFRWVVAADVEGPLLFNYKDSLEGIVFGDSTEVEKVDKIIQLTDYKVDYIGIKWKNCSPWYDFQNLKYDKAMKNSPWYQAPQ